MNEKKGMQCVMCLKWVAETHPFFDKICSNCVKSAQNKTKKHNHRANKLAKKLVDRETFGSVSTTAWLSMLVKHEFRCAGCNKRHGEPLPGRKKVVLSLDHILPLDKGGFHLPFNVQPLCLDCHALKDNNPNLHPWKEPKSRKKKSRSQRSRVRKLLYKLVGHDNLFYERIGKLKGRNPHIPYDELLIEEALICWLDRKMKENEDDCRGA